MEANKESYDALGAEVPISCDASCNSEDIDTSNSGHDSDSLPHALEDNPRVVRRHGICYWKGEGDQYNDHVPSDEEDSAAMPQQSIRFGTEPEHPGTGSRSSNFDARSLDAAGVVTSNISSGSETKWSALFQKRIENEKGSSLVYPDRPIGNADDVAAEHAAVDWTHIIKNGTNGVTIFGPISHGWIGKAHHGLKGRTSQAKQMTGAMSNGAIMDFKSKQRSMTAHHQKNPNQLGSSSMGAPWSSRPRSNEQENGLQRKTEPQPEIFIGRSHVVPLRARDIRMSKKQFPYISKSINTHTHTHKENQNNTQL